MIKGSLLNIGFVFDNKDKNKAVDYISSFIRYFIQKNGIIEKIQFSLDCDGEKWETYNNITSTLNDNLYYNLIKKHYGTIALRSDFIGIKNIEIEINIEKHDDYFGFLLFVKEEELIEFGKLNNINDITNKIIEEIKYIYCFLPYAYSFCDNDADIQYSPKQIKKIKAYIYSILIIASNKKELMVLESDWNIDGLTKRC